MTFTSFAFILFLLLLALLRTCARTNNGDKWLLLVAGISFYMSWSIPCVFLILFTAMMDFSVGRKLGQTASPINRKRLLLISLFVNLGMLGFFKYTNFFFENVCLGLNALGWNVGRVHYNIILPPAISFFTFASMSYVIDVYYERLPPCDSARDYALFLTFFPKLLSGPITRAIEFLPQLGHRVRGRAEDIEIGAARFLMGAVKKMIIADQVAGNVNLIFAAPSQYDRFTLLQGLLGYTVQLYCDFSGYSDMAIGCARVLGFRIPENFQMPFSARSITEFWRRWHMTLSNWLRDYIFLPLEIATRGNRNPTLRMSVNMMATMLLCGLWHGASWCFIIWGGIHGAALSAHKAWTTWKPSAFAEMRSVQRVMWVTFSHVLTLAVIILSFVFFRADSVSNAFAYLTNMLSLSHHGTRLISPYILPAITVVFLTYCVIPKDWNLLETLPQRPLALRIGAYTSLFVLLVFLGATGATPFIYFQF